MTLHVIALDGAGRRPRAPPGHGPGRRAAPAGRPDRDHRRRLRPRARLAARRSSTRSPAAREAIGGRVEVGAHDLPPAALAPARGRRRPPPREPARRRRARAPPVQRRLARRDRRDLRAGRAARAARRARGRGLRARAAPPRRADRAARRGARHDLRRAGSGARAAGSRSTCGATAGWPSAATTRATSRSQRLLAAKRADRSASSCPRARSRARCRRVLDALAPLHDLIDELLVVDGDSRDGTVDIAREHGVRVDPSRRCSPSTAPRWQGRRDVARPRAHHRRARLPSSTPTPRTSTRLRRSACSARC